MIGTQNGVICKTANDTVFSSVNLCSVEVKLDTDIIHIADFIITFTGYTMPYSYLISLKFPIEVNSSMKVSLILAI